MRNLILVIGFILTGIAGYSQIQYLRYNDDFSFLKSDSVDKRGFQKLKYIHLSAKLKVSFGGEVREQLQWYNNINFGDMPPTFQTQNVWQLWHRIMAHTNIEAGQKTRVFVQLNSTQRFLNHNPLAPEIEQNELSLHQAFIDYRFNKFWMARIGRQEISYGSHRLITFREGPNTRLTFDAAILKYNNGRRKVDVFAISPVISQKGVFDDQTFKDLAAGIYATEKLAKKLSIDYYLVHFHSSRRQYNFVAGIENREISGFRLFSENPKTNYEVEGTYQFGKFRQLSINAFGISADLNHKIVFKKNMIIGLAGNYLTGDNSRTDRHLNTYNLLYSKPQYGLTAPIGATNMITINPYLRINPVRKINVYLAANFIWRESNQDGTYSPGALEVRPRPENLFVSSEKQLGTLLALESAYAINSNFSIAVDASKFFASKYVKQTGAGRDITYYSLKASFKL
ncbi:MAG: alginate export family protein [Chitinophagaceae bacterium]|nr:alginate export family protein [Chitinophagaceae bacterium]